jgi:hypothetical protein
LSRYLVDKFMRSVNMNRRAEEEYKKDPAGFVAEWEKGQGLKFAAEEKEALAARDYAKLYALGAHPFLLWSFTEAVWTPEVPRDRLVKDYKEKTAAVGYPSFKT